MRREPKARQKEIDTRGFHLNKVLGNANSRIVTRAHIVAWGGNERQILFGTIYSRLSHKRRAGRAHTGSLAEGRPGGREAVLPGTRLAEPRCLVSEAT